jgi:D-tyrosyl-tRNA(Tyr) deacylase
MRTVVQRVARAEVRVAGELLAGIGRGLLLLVGVEVGDTTADAERTAAKIAALRLFPGTTPMDRSVAEVGGACLVVSQFTLAADLRQGRRPGFARASPPAVAEPLYLQLAAALRRSGLEVATGVFGADMAIELVNDGPVTFVLDVRDGVVARTTGTD